MLALFIQFKSSNLYPFIFLVSLQKLIPIPIISFRSYENLSAYSLSFICCKASSLKSSLSLNLNSKMYILSENLIIESILPLFVSSSDIISKPSSFKIKWTFE